MRAVLGLQFAFSVAQVLKFDKSLITFWFDSINVLWWVHRSRSFKPFIANHIGEIQASSEPRKWRHVSKVMNQADLSARNMSVGDLKKSRLWWEGPDFLKWNEEFWPEKKIDQNPEAAKKLERAKQRPTLEKALKRRIGD